MALHKCGNCTSENLGLISGQSADDRKVFLVICWNCGEIGRWLPSPKEAMDSWDRAGGRWEGAGVVDGQ